MGSTSFTFKKYGFDPETGELRLSYSLDRGPDGKIAFEEVITFPKSDRTLAESEQQTLDQAFQLIFLLAGVSYYKTYVPPVIKCESFALDNKCAAFIENVYRHGLGEFAHQNKITLDFKIESYDIPSLSHAAIELPDKILVPVGGGKDSIVTIETLKKAGEDITLFALGGPNGPATPIQNTIERSGLPALNVQRVLCPNLIKVNKQGAFNGHVPITAILSAIALACAVLHGFKMVVLSNEHSASAPNIKIGEHEVNHQYSKSLDFEKDLSCYVHDHIASALDYFSFLRPLTETAIARRFARLDNYHDIFRSCNTAFRQDEKTRGTNWCCDCPKCRFVFLALAPFMDKEKLVTIFGKNLLDDVAQLEGFKELCGLIAHKPFECVGEIEESTLLVGKLTQLDAWKDDTIIENIGAQDYNDIAYAQLFTCREGHSMPDKYYRILNEPK